MERREIFAGNWKMHKTHAEAVELIKGIIEGTKNIKDKEIVVFPPSPYVRDIVGLSKGTTVDVGMQNMYHESEGAFTGEVAPPMVKDTGCRYILIGHSERRHVFGETDEEVNLKVKAAFENDLEPMICIGELLDERDKGLTEEVLRTQVEGALKDISKEQMKKAVLAYEPVWAIGTGKVATPEMAEDAHKYIRELLGEIYDDETAALVPVLYGGSVKPDNVLGLCVMDNIDGALIGGASLKIESFVDIIKVK